MNLQHSEVTVRDKNVADKCLEACRKS